MNKGIKRICTILRNPKYPQIQDRLIETNGKGKIIGKCALGEVACQIGISEKVVMTFNSEDYHQILARTNIPKWLYNDACLPNPMVESASLGSYDNEFYSLQNIIVSLNDHGFEYHEIADFLEVTFGDVKK